MIDIKTLSVPVQQLLRRCKIEGMVDPMIAELAQKVVVSNNRDFNRYHSQDNTLYYQNLATLRACSARIAIM